MQAAMLSSLRGTSAWLCSTAKKHLLKRNTEANKDKELRLLSGSCKHLNNWLTHDKNKL